MNAERQPGGRPPDAKFAVGETVVYASHGTGRVIAREFRTVLGTEQEVVVLETDQGLVVTLPIAQARERLRPIAGPADVQQVQQTLRKASQPNKETWQKRLTQRQAKLASGDLLELTEIVRDGIRQESPQDGHPKLSTSERKLYLQARQLLAQEISAACGLELAEADAWIEQQVASA